MLKLFIKGFVLVSVLFVITLIISRYDNLHLISDSNLIRIKAAKEQKNLDVLFIGSSYVYSGVVPSKFDSAGINSFNLGIATAGAYYTQLISEDFLETSKTKTVCISIAYTTFSDIASDIWHSYPIHRYVGKPISNERLLVEYGQLENYVQTFRNSFKKGLKNLRKKTTGIDSVAYRRVLTAKGYEISQDTVTPEKLKEEESIFSAYEKSAFSNNKTKRFLNTIELFKQKGVTVILIEPPTYCLKNYFTKEFQSDYNNFKSDLKKHIRVIECDSVSFNSDCFRNTDHLNYIGANRYSNFLVKQLTSIL